MNCRRCGGPVPSYSTRRADVHADELECWQYQRAAICSLEDRVDILQGLVDSLTAHEHGADYAPPIVPDCDGAECGAALGQPNSVRRVKLMPVADGGGGDYPLPRADVVDGVVLHDPSWHGR